MTLLHSVCAALAALVILTIVSVLYSPGSVPRLAAVQQDTWLPQLQAAASLCLASDQRSTAGVACSSVSGAAAAASQSVEWAPGPRDLQLSGFSAGMSTLTCTPGTAAAAAERQQSRKEV